MKALFTMAVATMMAMPVLAETTPETTEVGDSLKTEKQTAGFTPQDTFEEGFVTKYLNDAIAKNWENDGAGEKKEYGANITKYASAPSFGGYYMAGFYYSGKDGAHSGDGFKQKNVRLYVKGTLFDDFAYLLQLQTSNASFHVKDYWLEWKKYKEFQIKAGQFIRVFGFECPYNPYEYHDGAYAQVTAKLAAQADFIGYDNGGGRDQGIQFQGDLFPVGQDQHSLIHYQFMISNGQTINASDANSQKDLSGTIQIQPIKGLTLAAWGWTGNFTCTDAAYKGVTVNRDRYMFSIFYDKDDWTFRSEYGHSVGHKVSDYQKDGTWAGTGRAQGWYATLGIPCSNVVKTWLKYDAYQDDGTKNTTRSIYSVSPSIQVHKNMWFQPRLAYVHENLGDQNYCEASVEFGVRF